MKNWSKCHDSPVQIYLNSSLLPLYWLIKVFSCFFMNSRTRFKFDYDMLLMIYATFARFSVKV